ncbi:MAG: response regulator transcription factor [Spirochaetales bacterium]|nr:response regulator transcription factor [Spirochaetales bacterium]
MRTILESRAQDIEVVAIAGNGLEAVEISERLMPDIILMDVRMPVLDGVEATRKIHAALPDIKIVMLTTFDDDEYVTYSLSHGAIGYLLKNRPPAELIASLRAVCGGVLQIDPAVSKSLIHDEHKHGIDDDDFLRRLNSLTGRERDVLRLLVEARDNRSISEHLHVTEQTVRNYVSTIYTKLGIPNRVEIMRHMDKVNFFLNHFSG